MTPLKRIIWDGWAVYTEDHAGVTSLVCVGANNRQTEWLVKSLEAYHKVPVDKVEVGTVHGNATGGY